MLQGVIRRWIWTSNLTRWAEIGASTAFGPANGVEDVGTRRMRSSRNAAKGNRGAILTNGVSVTLAGEHRV